MNYARTLLQVASGVVLAAQNGCVALESLAEDSLGSDTTLAQDYAWDHLARCARLARTMLGELRDAIAAVERLTPELAADPPGESHGARRG